MTTKKNKKLNESSLWFSWNYYLNSEILIYFSWSPKKAQKKTHRYLKQVYLIKPILEVLQFNITSIYTCLTFGTIIRCCTISVWQIDAMRVKTSSLAESLQTIFSRVFVCCFVSNFFRHSSVMYWTDILPSPYKHIKEKFAWSLFNYQVSPFFKKKKTSEFY